MNIKPILLDETGQEIVNILDTIKDNIQYVKGEKGDNYTITDQDYNAISELAKTKVIEEINPTLEDISGVSENAVEIAKGANQAISFDSYLTMITAFNKLDGTEYRRGQNVYIVTLGVPDLWISDVEDEAEEYRYVSDDDFITSLNAGGVQVGHYVFAMLETQKVDLTDYVKNTDYATSTKGGVVKINSPQGTGIYSSGVIYALTRGYDNYLNDNNGLFVSKGTLENVITGKGLISDTDYASANKGGSIKTSGANGTSVNSSGQLITVTKTNNEYKNASNGMLVGKGTLENLKEAFEFTLEDGTVVTKNIFVSPVE